MINGVLWAEVVIFAVFVGLRLYTRKQILNSVGADDYLVVVALVSATITNLPSLCDNQRDTGSPYPLHHFRHHRDLLRYRPTERGCR